MWLLFQIVSFAFRALPARSNVVFPAGCIVAKMPCCKRNHRYQAREDLAGKRIWLERDQLCDDKAELDMEKASLLVKTDRLQREISELHTELETTQCNLRPTELQACNLHGSFPLPVALLARIQCILVQVSYLLQDCKSFSVFFSNDWAVCILYTCTCACVYIRRCTELYKVRHQVLYKNSNIVHIY